VTTATEFSLAGAEFAACAYLGDIGPGADSLEESESGRGFGDFGVGEGGGGDDEGDFGDGGNVVAAGKEEGGDRGGGEGGGSCKAPRIGKDRCTQKRRRR